MSERMADYGCEWFVFGHTRWTYHAATFVHGRGDVPLCGASVAYWDHRMEHGEEIARGNASSRYHDYRARKPCIRCLAMLRRQGDAPTATTEQEAESDDE